MKYAKKILLLVALINLCFSFYAEGRILEFKFKKGDTSRILSTVVEEVYLNGIYQYTSTILNRISSEVTDVSKDGSGTCEANFMTSESFSSIFNSSEPKSIMTPSFAVAIFCLSVVWLGVSGVGFTEGFSSVPEALFWQPVNKARTTQNAKSSFFIFFSC